MSTSKCTCVNLAGRASLFYTQAASASACATQKEVKGQSAGISRYQQVALGSCDMLSFPFNVPFLLDACLSLHYLSSPFMLREA